MTSYIIRRVLLGIIVLLAVSVLIFGLMHLLPGDPLLLFLGSGELKSYSPEQTEVLRVHYGLDKPLVTQYFNWLGGLFHGDMGESIANKRSVSGMLAEKFPITVELGVLALFFSSVFGVTLGTICAIRRGKWADSLLSVIANLGITMPGFWIGILLIYIFAIKLGWLPTFGYTSPLIDFGMHIRKMIMPVFCLSIWGIAAITRQTRSSMLEVIQQDYVRTAWAKGLRERVIVFRHIIKNGLIPVITSMGLMVSYMFGGAVLAEVVFNVPGMGRMIMDGIGNADYQVVQGAVLLVSVTVVLVNILVDISYGWIDPRIHYN
jgi:peptide/nickel transport system permease protein